MLHWTAGVPELVRARPHLHVFADFDGTLSPLARTPEEAVLPERARLALERLVRRPSTSLTLVSGRPLEALERKVGVAGVDYVGNHGMDQRVAGRHFEDPLATAARPSVARLGALLVPLVAAQPGAVLEQKAISLSVHTRRLEPEGALAMEAAVRALAAAEPTMVVTGGKRIVEIRPRGAPDKGVAIERLLLAAHGPRWPEHCAALALGDDLTDEDAFRIVAARGAAILVLEGAPRPTAATFFAHDLPDALALLESL